MLTTRNQRIARFICSLLGSTVLTLALTFCVCLLTYWSAERVLHTDVFVAIHATVFVINVCAYAQGLASWHYGTLRGVFIVYYNLVATLGLVVLLWAGMVALTHALQTVFSIISSLLL